MGGKTMGKLIFSLLICFTLSSCITKYVAESEIHTQYVSKTDTMFIHDSISVLDSVYVWQKGDTVRIERWRTQNLVNTKYQSKTDTVLVHDTIPATRTEYLTRKESATNFAIPFALALIICGCLGFLCAYLIKKS